MKEYVYMSKKFKRIIALFCICVLFCASISIQVKGAEVDLEAIGSEAYAFIKDNYANGSSEFITAETAKGAGTSTMDWLVIALSRLGIQDNYSLYLEKLTDYVTTKYKEEGGLSDVKATEYHRIALAILACNGNPRCVGEDKIDLIKDGVYDRNKVAPLDAQGINGEIWALITVDAGNYQIPDDAYYTRDKIISSIISKQMADGSFGLIENKTDADITAMAVTALSTYYDSEKTYDIEDENTKEVRKVKVKTVVDKALEALSNLQLASGDYASEDIANASSTSQVIIALTSLNIDILKADDFIKEGNNLLDGLMKYKMDNGSFYRDNGNENLSDIIETEQALLAVAAIVRQNENKGRLYDFSGQSVKSTEGTKTENNYIVIYICVAGIVILFIIGAVVFIKRKKPIQEN